MHPIVRSGAPMFAFGPDLRIVEWNAGAERLTGISAEEAVGKPCWTVLAGRADDGSLVCHRGCSEARLAGKGWPVATKTLSIRTAGRRRRAKVDTVSFDDRSFVVAHVLTPEPEGPPPARRPRGKPPHLTPRQLQMLELLAEGLTARRIAARLRLKETTVRNHIQAALGQLDAHSQLEAVAKARRRRLL